MLFAETFMLSNGNDHFMFHSDGNFACKRIMLTLKDFQYKYKATGLTNRKVRGPDSVFSVHVKTGLFP
jgi:hypothetical protein